MAIPERVDRHRHHHDRLGLATRIRNGSDAPVYEVVYELEAGVRGRYVGRVPSMPPAATMEILIPLPAYPRFDWATPRIRFRDAENVNWWRSSLGELEEGTPPEHLFKPDVGAYLDSHPTMELPRPQRLVDAGSHPRGGRVTPPDNRSR